MKKRRAKNIIFNPQTRRMFLKSSSGLLMAIPFLGSLNRNAQAAGSGNKKRYILVGVPNQIMAYYLCPAEMTSVQVPPRFEAATHHSNDTNGWPYRWINLSDIIRLRDEGNISSVLGSAFNNYANKLLIYRGVDYQGHADHGLAGLNGNSAGTILGGTIGYEPNLTIDEYLANSSSFYSGGRNNQLLDIARLGQGQLSTSQIQDNQGATTGTGIAANNAPLNPYYNNLNGLFKKIFKDAEVQPGGGSSSSPERLSRGQLLNEMFQSFTNLKSSGDLSNADRNILDEYFTRLEETSQSLGAGSNSNISSGSESASDYDDFSSRILNSWPNSLYPSYSTDDPIGVTQRYHQQTADILSLFIKAGVTQIGTIGLMNSYYDNTAIAHSGSVRAWHLQLAHGVASNYNEKLASVHREILENTVLRLLQNLDVTEGNGETYLDNTLIHYTAEMDWGHSGECKSGLIFGNTTSIDTGKMIDYCDYSILPRTEEGEYKAFTGRFHSVNVDGQEYGYNVAAGQPINRLWLSILYSLGLQPSECLKRYRGQNIQSFGDWMEYTSSNLPDRSWGTFFNDIIRHDLIDQPLPQFLKDS